LARDRPGERAVPVEGERIANVVLVREAGGRLRDRRGAGRRVLIEGGARDGRVVDERGLLIDLVCGFAVEPVRPGRGDRGTRERSGRDQRENQREQGEQRQGAAHEDLPAIYEGVARALAARYVPVRSKFGKDGGG